MVFKPKIVILVTAFEHVYIVQTTFKELRCWGHMSSGEMSPLYKIPSQKSSHVSTVKPIFGTMQTYYAYYQYFLTQYIMKAKDRYVAAENTPTIASQLLRFLR